MSFKPLEAWRYETFGDSSNNGTFPNNQYISVQFGPALKNDDGSCFFYCCDLMVEKAEQARPFTLTTRSKQDVGEGFTVVDSAFEFNGSENITITTPDEYNVAVRSISM